jgi:hypothetical protein
MALRVHEAEGTTHHFALRLGNLALHLLDRTLIIATNVPLGGIIILQNLMVF